MAVRAANRLARLKELMNLHMTSANDAFRFVSRLYSHSPHSVYFKLQNKAAQRLAVTPEFLRRDLNLSPSEC